MFYGTTLKRSARARFGLETNIKAQWNDLEPNLAKQNLAEINITSLNIVCL